MAASHQGGPVRAVASLGVAIPGLVGACGVMAVVLLPAIGWVEGALGAEKALPAVLAAGALLVLGPAGILSLRWLLAMKSGTRQGGIVGALVLPAVAWAAVLAGAGLRSVDTPPDAFAPLLEAAGVPISERLLSAGSSGGTTGSVSTEVTTGTADPTADPAVDDPAGSGPGDLPDAGSAGIPDPYPDVDPAGSGLGTSGSPTAPGSSGSGAPGGIAGPGSSDPDASGAATSPGSPDPSTSGGAADPGTSSVPGSSGGAAGQGGIGQGGFAPPPPATPPAPPPPPPPAPPPAPAPPPPPPAPAPPPPPPTNPAISTPWRLKSYTGNLLMHPKLKGLRVPEVTLWDGKGARWSLRGAVLHKAAWLIFVEPESPLADLYARNLDKLTAAFGSRVEFRIVLVRMGAGEVLTVEEAGLWADVRKLRGRQVLVDPFGKIKPASHEPPLPQHVLVGRDGVLHYQGSGKLGKAPIAEQLKALEGGGR